MEGTETPSRQECWRDFMVVAGREAYEQAERRRAAEHRSQQGRAA